MSRQNRQRAMECIAEHGSWLTLGDKLALVMIGDLVKYDEYYESQGRLAERMGVTRPTAGKSARKLTKHGALKFQRWMRTDSGSTVKVFEYQPECLTADVSQAFPLEVSEGFPPQVSGTFPPGAMRANGHVERNTQPGGKQPAGRWEENPIQVSETLPQTEEPKTENRMNRHKVAAAPRYQPESQTEIINETIAEILTNDILDNPELVEAERHRQRAALIGATT